MTDHHEPDVEGLIREGAKAGAKEVKLRANWRQLLWIYIFVVLACFGVWHWGREYTNNAQRTVERHMCVFLVPLLPTGSEQHPTSPYGQRILNGVEQGVKQNHCKVPK